MSNSQDAISSNGGVQQPSVHRDVRKQQKKDIWLLVVCLRLLAALTLSTFFQPDEYFQSLEPAWSLTFGSSSGAWITWVSQDGIAARNAFYQYTEDTTNACVDR